jgi:hypothetical protein
MIGGATTAALAAEKDLCKPGKGDSGRMRGPGDQGAPSAAAALAYTSTTDALHLKYTSKDGDVLEVDLEHREETFAGVAFATDAPADARSGLLASAAAGLAGANAEAAEPAAPDVDARLKKLAELRDWAAKVADEVRQQQRKILEEYLKRSGKFMPGSEGRFIVIQASPEDAKADAADCEAGVPAYWNAENTSDRIVHFATQMAQIAGKDSDFAATIIKAVSDGFDQANAATGPMPGAAGELNRKTHDLTMSKLSKWLEEHKAGGYNLGARTEENPTLAVPDGIENHA